MDRDRFDVLAKTVATRSTRRSLLALCSALGLAGRVAATEDGAAKKRKKKCKKKCGPCKTCKHGKCKPKPNGTPCDDGNPCTINDVCTEGICGGTAGNQGQVCGTSTHRGTTLRCCDGACPDPECVSSGYTGDSCAFNGGECAAITCCAKKGAVCVPPCFCPAVGIGELCASDQDCFAEFGPQPVCICSLCQLPPP